MLDFLEKHKKFFISGIAVICLILAVFTVNKRYKPTILNNALGFVITPVQSVVTTVGNWFESKISFITHMVEIEDENLDLKKQVEELVAENTRLKSIEQSYEEQAELLKVQARYSGYPTVGANVIAKYPGSWYDTFIIDKGTQDGFQKDMLVLSSGGLVGRIFEVGLNYSKVRSIVDDTSSIYAKSARTNDSGSLRGDSKLLLEGLCRMEFIDTKAEILEGDEIVTSHLSSVAPAGLSIGYVEKITSDYNGTKTAIVRPYVDFKHIETVLVITKVFEREYIDEPSE